MNVLKRSFSNVRKRLSNNKGNIISFVIIGVMVAVIAYGVVSSWQAPIKDLNDAATERLVIKK